MHERLIIPESMRPEIFKAIHEGHLGITKCSARAKEGIWWPGLSTQIERMISSCDSCSKQQVYRKEPMIKSEFPERPWQRTWYSRNRSDCGSQFSTTVETTREYKLFSKKYGFSIATSSPKYSQSNGFIESMVKNFKKHFEKSVDEDPYLMMLVLRRTPLENGYSPAELLMGRKLRTNLPMAKKSVRSQETATFPRDRVTRPPSELAEKRK
ncbi:hypothetical protein AVEN_2060-1 [Araneus ventricosus]|uniref:RNA-directed DNA polymerase n=1 Tax=Araneus ventricosus TaxID=182803 RepID=A0A4Y2MIN1_ARAVE|nr:hypothetical protein AVEN_2060-1 [Araneus ventricosus]